MTTTRWTRLILPAVAVAVVLAACGATGPADSPGGASSAASTPAAVTGVAVTAALDDDDPGDESLSASPSCNAVTQAEIWYARGTVAPSYHYEWTLSLSGTQATFSMRGGYHDDPAATWSRDFQMTRQTISELCDAAVRFGGEPGNGVGGALSSYSITSQVPGEAAVRRHSPIRSARDFGDYILSTLVPRQVWTEVNAQFQAWSFARQAEFDHTAPVPAVVDGDRVAPPDVGETFCADAPSGRIAYSSKGAERVDRMEILLTFAQGRAFLVVTPDFSGPYPQWDVIWDLGPAQQQELCSLALATLQQAPAGEPDPRSPGFDIVLTGGDRTVTAAGLDLAGASAPFVTALRTLVGDEVTEQTFAEWQRWVDQG